MYRIAGDQNELELVPPRSVGRSKWTFATNDRIPGRSKMKFCVQWFQGQGLNCWPVGDLIELLKIVLLGSKWWWNCWRSKWTFAARDPSAGDRTWTLAAKDRIVGDHRPQCTFAAAKDSSIRRSDWVRFAPKGPRIELSTINFWRLPPSASN